MTIFDIFGGLLMVSLCMFGFGAGVMTLLLRVFSWYGALLLTIFIYPLVKKLLLTFIPDFFLIGYITILACGGAFSAMVYFIAEPMLEGQSAPQKFEKFAGAGLGILLAILLLGTTNFVVTQVNGDVQPDWMKGSKIEPIIKKSSQLQSKFLEDNVNKILFDLGIK